jgi:two-component system, OmpR family, phosphate regulon sensor histidine kinase PhoR
MPTITSLLLVAIAALGFAWWRERTLLRRAEARHRAELEAQRAEREVELVEQARRTTALFDRMVEGLIVTDANGLIRLANRAAGNLFGFTPPAEGRTLLETTRRHEVSAVAVRLESESEVLDQELQIEGAGAPRFLQINALALRDSRGERDGAILVFHDLTRLRQLEGVRQEFVANVSHELRTPLSLIKSAAETLIDGASNDPVALTRFLEIIDRHANRLTLLIDDLLLLSTLDSGRMRLQLQALPLRSAVEEVFDDFQARARARRIIMENHVRDDVVAHADPGRVRQVLSNLVDNAIKYGCDGGCVVVSGSSLKNGFIETSVRDDGPGLQPEAQKRMFERFYRVDKARSREQGGTGLGLSIVKHVVQAHGGEVRVVSAPDQGTTFVFTLPAESGN